MRDADSTWLPDAHKQSGVAVQGARRPVLQLAVETVRCNGGGKTPNGPSGGGEQASRGSGESSPRCCQLDSSLCRLCCVTKIPSTSLRDHRHVSASPSLAAIIAGDGVEEVLLTSVASIKSVSPLPDASMDSGSPLSVPLRWSLTSRYLEQFARRHKATVVVRRTVAVGMCRGRWDSQTRTGEEHTSESEQQASTGKREATRTATQHARITVPGSPIRSALHSRPQRHAPHP